MTVWLVYCVNLVSMGDIVVRTMPGGYQYRTLEVEKDTKYIILYMVFQFFWTTEFIVSLGQIAIALAAAYWYFSPTCNEKDGENKEGGKPFFIGSITVLKAIHSTAAFGPLVIAITKTIRAILTYIQKQAVSHGNNKLVKAILCCLQCCMWCLEKCLKYISVLAYCQTALYGSSFCPSAVRAVEIVVRNIARIGAVSMCSVFTINVGRIFIAAGGAYIAMQPGLLISPTIVTSIHAYMVSNVFMNILDMTITSAIVQCFLVDEEMNGESGTMFARKELKAWVEKYGRWVKEQKEKKEKALEDLRNQKRDEDHQKRLLQQSYYRTPYIGIGEKQHGARNKKRNRRNSPAGQGGRVFAFFP